LEQGDLSLFIRSTQGYKWPRKDFFFKKPSSDEPVDQMHNYLAWIIPMTDRYKIVQLLSLRSHMTPP